jgi:hypothetical protein
MKIRQGFVSNSSSSSFLLDAGKLTAGQLGQIEHHIEEARRLGIDKCADPSEAWTVEVTGATVLLDTMLDNFDMSKFLERIGANEAILRRY